MCDSDQYDVELQAELDKTMYLISRGIQGRRNNMIEQTRDFRLICIVFNVIVPSLKIIVGITFLNECPVDQYIPMYLFVGGMLQIIFMTILIFRRKKGVLEAVIGIILVVWFQIASVNIFFEWEPDFFVTSPRYCHKFLYTFAFTVSLSEYVTVILVVLYLCIVTSFEPCSQ